MEFYKGIRLRQVLENNNLDVKVVSERNAFFCVPASETAYALIHQWCAQNEIPISDVVRVIRNGNTGKTFYLCSDIRVEKKPGVPEPRTSPWGRIQTIHTLCEGVYEVSTASHGGIMVANKLKDKYLSKYAQEEADKWGPYLCYEEDCQAPIALRELLDRKHIKCTPGFHGTPEEFEKCIDRSLQQWQPVYYAIRANMMAYGKYVFKPGDICKYEDGQKDDFCAIVEIVSIVDFGHGIVEVKVRYVARDNEAKYLETRKSNGETLNVGMRKLHPCPPVPKANDKTSNNSAEIAELVKFLEGKRTLNMAKLNLTELAKELLSSAYNDGRKAEYANTCTEVCPHCENEITLCWTPETDGYKAHCPICGKRLMLCDACQHDGDKPLPCDYCSATDSCRHNHPRKRKVTKR